MNRIPSRVRDNYVPCPNSLYCFELVNCRYLPHSYAPFTPTLVFNDFLTIPVNHTKQSKGSAERVDFAIKLPGKDDEAKPVLFPIYSKFPMEDYQRLIDAQEAGDVLAATEAAKLLEVRIKQEAKSIHDKYINPPSTTDFAIMFLPIEGLFAEVLRRSGLWETLQREYRGIITGPTTITALLNSLQMGFRTLAIQKRSSEVWKLLGAVKTEFGKFGEVLKKRKRNSKKQAIRLKLQQPGLVQSNESCGLSRKYPHRKLRNFLPKWMSSHESNPPYVKGESTILVSPLFNPETL
jgi:hypothetical protein